MRGLGWIAGFGINEGTTLLELRCENYVVGTALLELRCGNYVVGISFKALV